MRTSRIFIPFALLMLAIIGALAWFVFSTPEKTASRSDSAQFALRESPQLPSAPAPRTEEPAIGQRPALTRFLREDEDIIADSAAAAEQPPPAPRAETNMSALSEHVAFGPRKTDPSRTRKAATNGTRNPAPMQSEILDTSPVAVPFALLDPVASTASAPEQVAALNQLREGFAHAIGGPKQDPESQAYREKWKAAQPDADQQYRLWFGDQAYMAQQRAQHLDQQAR